MDPFPQLKHFHKNERWGRPYKMSHLFLEIVDAYRDELGIGLYVSRGFALPNKPDEVSAHYPDKNGICHAGDFIVMLTDKEHSLLDCFLLACKYPFSGIGIYPYWKLSRLTSKGTVVYKGGIHLDTSPTVRKLPRHRSSGTWIGVLGKKNKNIYFEVSKWELKRFGLI